MVNLVDAICAAARHHGSRTAVWARGETLTYDELLETASRTATLLLDAGVQPGDRIAILAQRSVHAYAAIVTALRAGGVYVPLNPRYPIDRNRAMLEASQATALIIDATSAKECADLLRTPGLRAIVVPDGDGRAAIAATEARRDLPVRAAADDCYLLFTSGSTGRPKGVPITHGNVLAYVAGIDELIAITHEDRLIQLADLTFDLSGHDLWMAWTHGAALYSVPETATLFASRFVEEHELTGWCSVPSAVGLARKAGLIDAGSLPSVRFSVFCGEALRSTVADAWADAVPNSVIFNLYGPTEATIAISAHRYRPGEPGPAVVSLGMPLGTQQMALFDADNRPVPTGEIGELLLAGSQLARCYWHAPEIDAQKFVEIDGTRWYRTGDLARFDPQSGYHYAGRIDQQIKVLGYRVEVLEIESALRGATNRELAVVPWPITEDGGAQGTVAFVVGDPLDEEAVTATMRASLPPYMIPARFVYLSALPLNQNGKTDYPALRTHPSL
ncbi:MAG TPA: amino acid adenylation domain-containing protein [Kofleriaceae bacterium]|jgi:amino acid adenylation domain-containing protein